MGKIRIIDSKELAGALAWMGYKYHCDECGRFVFDRTRSFDNAFKAIHSTKALYGNKYK